MLSLAVLGIFLSCIAAQTTLQIEAIEAHFKQSGIVPSLLTTFDPSAVLAVNYEGVGAITPGQALSKDQVGATPTITVTAANSSVALSGNFTLAMVDADIVGTNESGGVNRHWLVNSVTVSDGAISNDSAVAITAYAGPGPASGSGPHRYVILLYSQPTDFHPPAEFQNPIPGVSKFNLSTYVSDSGLGSLVAAFYYTVEEGTATVSVSPTSAVVTSTLATGSGSGSGASAGSGTGTASGVQPSKSNAASKVEGMPFTGAAMVMMMLGALF